MEQKLFKEIQIETNSFCTRKCIFCPKYKDENWNKITEMSIETIHKIVKELKELNYISRINVTGFKET